MTLNLYEFYEACQNFVIHQNTLVNERLTWLLVAQGLLFTAFGIVIDKDGDYMIHRLRRVLPIFGFLSSLLIGLGIAGALRAVTQANNVWLREVTAQGLKSSDLPPLIGGINGVGTISSVPLCVLFMAAWGYLLLPKKGSRQNRQG